VSSVVKKNKKDLLIFIPAIITFFLVLIPTIKYSVPLSSETFYHVISIQFAAENGIYLGKNALFSGLSVYSPLFDFFLLAISKIFALSYLMVARALQPVFAFLVVLSFSFGAYKMYNLLAGILTGIFVMFSALFHKIMFTSPETMFLILVPLIAYFYCVALENKNLKYSLISGLLLGMGFLTQAFSASIIFLVLTILTIILLIVKRKTDLKVYGLLMITSILIAAIWWLPVIFNGQFMQGIPIPAQLSTLIAINEYPQILGIIPLLFAFIGAFFFIKRGQIKDILLLTWLVTATLLSFIQYSGFSIGAEYILMLAIFPLAAMAGVGVQCIRIDGDKRPIYALTALILILGVYYGYVYANSTQPEYSTAQIEAAQWFQNHGDRNSTVINYNSTMDALIFSMANQNVPTFHNSSKIPEISQKSEINVKKYLMGKYNGLDILNDNIGYLVMNKEVSSMPYATLVYENEEFKIFEINK
jgi:4-amino-4-deoxy-L-arabinose transferase-like glycosyltransferase